MQYAIHQLYPTDRKDTSRSERIAKHTAQFTTIKSLPNDMQYTIGILYSRDRKDTLRSVPIERIIKPSAPLTNIKKVIFLSLLNECNIRSVNCALRSVSRLNDPYGSNGSLNLLLPH